MEDSNKTLMKYFEKFENVINYSYYKNKLEFLSKFRFLGVIKIKDQEIPRIGPSDELKDFHKLLYDFEEDKRLEIKFVIKNYEDDNIETKEECLELIRIIFKNNIEPEKIEILNRIKHDVENDTKIYKNEYTKILKDDKENYLLNGLFSFLLRRII